MLIIAKIFSETVYARTSPYPVEVTVVADQYKLVTYVLSRKLTKVIEDGSVPFVSRNTFWIIPTTKMMPMELSKRQGCNKTDSSETKTETEKMTLSMLFFQFFEKVFVAHKLVL